MAAEHVEVRVEVRVDATVVRVAGVLDALALPEVSRELTDAQRGPGAVYVDLEAVTFIDSRGLGALLAANERAREGAPPVRLYRPSVSVQRLLEVSGVRGVLSEVEELPAD
jgi:anti-anti-sigma factor